MMRFVRSRLFASSFGALVLILAACAPGQSPAASQATNGTASGSTVAAAPKRITAAIAGNPSILYWTLAHNSGQTAAGTSSVDDMLNGRLATYDDRGALVAQLAETVPTVQNGLWKVFPDGRMETTWTIRPNVRWHDGAAFTTQDVLFTAQLIQDKELAVFRDVRYDAVESIEAVDDRTFTVAWKSPRIEAAEIFTVGSLPKHILEPIYVSNKAGFTEQRFWGESFIGTGAFKLAEFERGSHLVVRANDEYVLGRPKLDEVIVRFIPDANALMANIISGSVDLTLGQTLSLDQASQLHEQWHDGAILSTVKNMWLADPQHLDPSPSIVGNVDFRRAMLYGLDRQTLADTIGYGAPVGDSLVSPISADLPLVAGGIVRYSYDPQRAAQMFEQLGYTRGPDGLYQDATGERLNVEVRTSAGDANEKLMLAVANQWRQLGVATSPLLMSAAQNQDAQFRATFPAFSIRSHATGLSFLRYFFHSDVARTPERNFLGSNALRYRNPEMDGLIERYFATVAEGPRMEIATEAVRHLTSNVVTMNLFHGTSPTVARATLANVGPGGERAEQTWNSATWTLR